ncbi:phosphoserine aminotransferase [Legionella quinlivanii]|uniref:Phosphoserine aminotransferase n=1 Tax=Legionella quinlivanii TaxID=45073 RepID=A0A0W0XZR7_9GAMM|nr:3-phosphoserine/phosphohydroxythreonine transaminase [Legionella quinlivanii]KTD50053.1 phosphoserine aminotransferase [Legionella quinlivanii]SEF93322.1 phosphoserine aminotransferase apoenzyme [Legionella quinlivanii DSM 21216]STY11171.1 phosphoserine aminotransferase [Legionella quinlivanii]
MSRGYNFGAGPAMLPDAILSEVQAELLDWNHTGMSVMEIGHRTKEFTQIMEESEALLRELLAIPGDYHVLFISGAARSQFGMIPLNFLSENQKAGYFQTGIWSEMAYEEACRLSNAYSVCSADKNYSRIPERSAWEILPDTRYLYYTPNETVNGLRFSQPPIINNIPLIADMTSCLLSEPININDYALIFAGAQKNIANAGLTLVIVRDDLIKEIGNNAIPRMLDYRTYTTTRSMYATPPTFNCYLALKMFQWIKSQGGVEALYQLNCTKSRLLYEFIDASDFYGCKIRKEDRALVNVCFTLKKPQLEEEFLEKARNQGLLALAGHRTVGGLRASIYNSMPLAAVDKLIDFMAAFAKEHENEC